VKIRLILNMPVLLYYSLSGLSSCCVHVLCINISYLAVTADSPGLLAYIGVVGILFRTVMALDTFSDVSVVYQYDTGLDMSVTTTLSLAFEA
jgi:hypothetical protein